MKNLFLAIASVLAFSFAASAQEAPATSNAEINFEKEVHDYGNIKQGGDATCEFKFTNTGTEPLIISNAKGSCGCTVPEWPREPIAPGESGVIRVKYDSKRPGVINKTVTITSNAKNSPTKVLRIKGNVETTPKADESAMPAKEPAQAAPTVN